MQGRVYYDLDRNNRYNNPPDVPIANTLVLLVVPNTMGRKRVASQELCRGTTDGVGNFVIPCEVPTGIEEIAVVKESRRFEPLLVLTPTGQIVAGQEGLNVPVLRPVKPTFISLVVKDNIAKVRGRGVPGRTIRLLSNGTARGSRIVRADGTFVVRSNRMGSGIRTMSIVQLNEMAAESDPVVAGNAVIPDPVQVNALMADVEGNIIGWFTLSGSKALAAARITIRIGSRLLGTATASNDGTFSVSGLQLASGESASAITVTQSNESGEADPTSPAILRATATATGATAVPTVPQPGTSLMPLSSFSVTKTISASKMTSPATNTSGTTSAKTSSTSETTTSVTTQTTETTTSFTSSTSTNTPTLTALLVSPSSVFVLAGETLQTAQLFVSGNFSDGSSRALDGNTACFVWSTSDSSIANVSDAGLLTAVSAGDAVVSVSCNFIISNNVTATAIGISRLIVEPAAPYLILGAELTFILRYELSNGTLILPRSPITWVSSNLSVSNVTAAGGVLSAISVGSSVVTATVIGRSTTAAVTIVEVCHTFSSATDPALVLPADGVSSNTAILTGTDAVIGIRSKDPSDRGWLQFTYEGSPTSQVTGFGYSTTTFSLAEGVQIEFDFASYKWSSEWALLGLTLQLFDADVTFSRGALGAFGMGYKADGANAGLAGGYAAVGFMDWSENNGHFCGNQQPTGTNLRDYVCIRGAVSGFGNGSAGLRTDAASYPLKAVGNSNRLFIISQRAGSSPVLQSSDQWSSPKVYQNRPPAYKGQPGYRRAIIRITAAPNPVAIVWILYANDTTPVQFLNNIALDPISRDQKLRIGFSGIAFDSGGFATAFFEMRDLVVKPLVSGQAGPACVPQLVGFTLRASPAAISVDPLDRSLVSIATTSWSDFAFHDLLDQDRQLTFSSSNGSVATVDPATGIVASVGQGTTLITGTLLTGDGRTLTATVNIFVLPIVALRTIPREPLLLVDSALNMRIEYELSDGTIVPTTRCGTWSSSDPNSVNITTTGFLQVIANNNATLSVSVPIVGIPTATAEVIVVEISHSFMDPTDPKAILGGTAVLTGNGTTMSGITDPIGQGWLRLIDNGATQLGYVYFNSIFTMATAIEFSFEFTLWKWDSIVGDGFSAFFFDADVPFLPGSAGKGLVYQTNLPNTPGIGLGGGYSAVFIDAYGNGCYNIGGLPDTVCLKGSVVGFGNGSIGERTSTSSYPTLAATRKIRMYSLLNAADSVPQLTPSDNRQVRPAANVGDPGYRRLIVKISPGPNPTANVWIQFGTEAEPTVFLQNAAMPPISLDQRLKIGFGASSGGVQAFMEVRNMRVTPLPFEGAATVCSG